MVRFALAAAAVALMAAPGFAAQDGTFGATSAGSFNVSGEVVPPTQTGVRISGLTDLNVGIFDPTGGTLYTMPVCIYHTSPTFSLRYTASTGGTFVAGPNNASLGLFFGLRNLGGTNIAFLAPYDTPVGGLVANRVSSTCQTGGSQLVQVINSVVPSTAPAGVYSAVINITLAVE